MLLREYSPLRAQKIDAMVWPESTAPYGAKIVWVKTYDTEQSTEIYTGAHKHVFCEAHLALFGTFEYQCGNQTFAIKAGQGLLVAPTVEHTYLPAKQGYKKCSIAFSVEIGSALYQNIVKRGVAAFSLNQELTDCLNALYKAVDQNHCFAPKLMNDRAFEAVYILLQLSGIALPAQSRLPAEDMRFAVAQNFIYANLHRAFSCSEVAAACGLSHKQLNRIFLKHTGSALFAYVRAARLRQCEELLLKTDYPIKAISRMVGFENEYYFSNFFKRHYGMPPGYFRNKNQSK